MSVNSLPKTVKQQRRDCDLNPGPSAPDSSTMTTRLPSHETKTYLSPISVYNSSLPGQLHKSLHSTAN